MKLTQTLAGTAIALLVAAPLAAQPAQVEAGIQPYARTSGVSGSLSSIGSDTLNNLMTFWAEGFQKAYPNVRIQIEGKGSSTAPPALIAGTSQLGPMSRAMKAEEIDEFEKKYGYKPTVVRVAVDGLAVYVNKDNPLEQLTLAEVDAIFSKTRKGGHKRDLTTWGDLGLTGEWAAKPISLYGRNSASGTYGFFKESALFKGDYRDTVKEQPGSASVVQGVTEDRFAIGYSGIGYRTSGVKPLKLARKAGEPYFSTEASDVLTGKYPLSRFLYVYVNKAPNKPLDPLIGEFLRFVLSREGQEIVVKDGYLPVSARVVDEENGKLR
ncbi:MAG: phosphate ABC transporter substrate-binding protein [Thermoanaerobaculia bacterium]|jgi:phosphate transport system substrate-binding protein|nr:MAG: phosphate ABC transporter substrate-binding protein [Thermoanaerobaculia bacterium]MBZ0102039.1 phosphate ABC transporter substrate-binding protein [Thermoanaerobaculia bacterium]